RCGRRERGERSFIGLDAGGGMARRVAARRNGCDGTRVRRRCGTPVAGFGKVRMARRGGVDPERKSFALRVPLDYIVRRSRTLSVAARPGVKFKQTGRASEPVRQSGPPRAPGERSASRMLRENVGRRHSSPAVDWG
ncbi:hypothetical protein, partial [Burkholderia gladioli]|uniref:hypothetical protein n=1 Tax=Burkholderia gladioli TaxID=28095 RepID=UPI003F795B40